MKLNNKGFAITGILYGLLILFALLVASYLMVLTARKNRLDNIITDIEEEYNNSNMTAEDEHNGTFYTITIVQSANTTTTLSSDVVNNGSSYSYEFEPYLLFDSDITTGVSTSYSFKDATCTNEQVVNISTFNLTNTLTIAEVTSDTTCILNYVNNNDNNNKKLLPIEPELSTE